MEALLLIVYGRCQSIDASWTARQRQPTCGIMRPVEVRSVGKPEGSASRTTTPGRDLRQTEVT
jgi:hypothetical protein